MEIQFDKGRDVNILSRVRWGGVESNIYRVQLNKRDLFLRCVELDTCIFDITWEQGGHHFRGSA